MSPLIVTILFSVTNSIAETGKLEVIVQEMFSGAELDAVVVVRQDDRDYSDRFKDDLSGYLDYGNYVVTVTSDGFRSRRQVVELRQPELSMRIGLSVGIGWYETLTTVRGRIDEAHEGEDLWVSLTPLLGANWVGDLPKYFQHSLKSNGQFEFPNVEHGHYLLAVVQGFPEKPREYVRVLFTRYVKVHPDMLEVRISLPAQ
jgi:hypothetical protein